ncbi:MAG: hypothetical protein NPIRA04_28990 [Nitrospirales bacterium]|nr:MAG: hypothetical protein NPIRA04_28990 [Nitrospirales bacterium]
MQPITWNVTHVEKGKFMKPCISQRAIIGVCGVISLCLLFVSVGYGEDISQQKTTQPEAMDAAMETMMAKWQAYASPSDNHEVLNPLVGTWSHVVKWWMKPGSVPEVSKGTSETTWLMGGRYLKHTATGTSMGQPFNGLGFTGFDNKKRKYQTVWMDNMGTGMMTGEGTYDHGQKTLTDQGLYTDALMGQRAYRGVITFVDENHHRYEMFSLDQTGQEFRMMEIVYTRTNEVEK